MSKNELNVKSEQQGKCTKAFPLAFQLVKVAKYILSFGQVVFLVDV